MIIPINLGSLAEGRTSVSATQTGDRKERDQTAMEKHQPTQQWYVAPKCAALSDGNQVRINILIDNYYADNGTPDDSAHRTERTHPFQLSDQLYSKPIALFLPVKAIRGKLRTIPAFLNPLTRPQRRYISKQRLIPNILCYLALVIPGCFSPPDRVKLVLFGEKGAY